MPATVKPSRLSMHLYGEDTFMTLIQDEICGLVVATQQPLQRVNFRSEQHRLHAASAPDVLTTIALPSLVTTQMVAADDEGEIRPRTRHAQEAFLPQVVRHAHC